MAKFVATGTITEEIAFDAKVPEPKLKTLKRDSGRDVQEMTNERAVLKGRSDAAREAMRLAKAAHPKATDIVVVEVRDA